MADLFTPSAAPVAAGSPGTDPAATGDGPIVVGLDLSLTATGYAGPDGTRVIKSNGHKGDTLAQRFDRLDTLCREVTYFALCHDPIPFPDLVCVEAPSLGQGRQGGTHDRSGLWWMVVKSLMEHGPEVIEVPPATLKKYVTGKGNAQKPDVRMAIFKRYGLDIADDNAADAFALRAIGLDLLGHPLAPMPAANRAALEKLPRPAVPGAA